jgi:hypothetical protein
MAGFSRFREKKMMVFSKVKEANFAWFLKIAALKKK